MRLEYAEEFLADLDRNVSYLREQREWGWVEALQENLAEVEELIESFPDSGFELAREAGEVLRRLRLRRAPYYVWYRMGSAPDASVTLLRLFHVRQNAPKPHAP